MIDPRTLKGFRDYLPEVMIPREQLLEQARRVYRSYGFAPIDTPALEYTEILLGKGGTESDKQLYRFTDAGGSWGEIIGIDCELCSSDGGPRVDRTFVYSSPTSVATAWPRDITITRSHRPSSSLVSLEPTTTGTPRPATSRRMR